MDERAEIVPVDEQLVGETEHFDLPEADVDVQTVIEEEGVEPVFMVSEDDIAGEVELEHFEEGDLEAIDDEEAGA